MTFELVMSPPPPQAEDFQDRKRPQLEKPFPISIDEATTKNTSHNTTVALPPPDTADANNTDADPSKGTRANLKY
jgi:hypothetical protein